MSSPLILHCVYPYEEPGLLSANIQRNRDRHRMND